MCQSFLLPYLVFLFIAFYYGRTKASEADIFILSRKIAIRPPEKTLTLVFEFLQFLSISKMSLGKGKYTGKLRYGVFAGEPAWLMGHSKN